MLLSYTGASGSAGACGEPQQAVGVIARADRRPAGVHSIDNSLFASVFAFGFVLIVRHCSQGCGFQLPGASKGHCMVYARSIHQPLDDDLLSSCCVCRGKQTPCFPKQQRRRPWSTHPPWGLTTAICWMAMTSLSRNPAMMKPQVRLLSACSGGTPLFALMIRISWEVLGCRDGS